MKFTIAKNKLSHLLYLASTIVERRNTMPVLANVKITADKNSISIAATDLEISLIGSAEAQVENSGDITVGAKVLYDIVKEMPADTVTAKLVEGQRLEIESGKSKFKIVGTSSDEFPSIDDINLTNPLSIEASKFYEMLDKTAFAVSTDETRYNINGVFVENIDIPGEKDSSGIRFVSTDGHRLAIIDRNADGLTLQEGVIIPRKGIQELRKMLENEEGDVIVGVEEGFYTVQCSDVTIRIRLVDGQFPDYRQVIPSSRTTEITVDRSSLLSTVKRVSLVTTDKSKTIRFSFSNNELNISSSSPEYGEASEQIPIVQEGDNITIGFSARYVIDVLNTMVDSENVKILLNGDLGPGVFQSDKDELFRCIVMPMRFDS